MNNFYLTKPIKIPVGHSMEPQVLKERLSKLLGTSPQHLLSVTLHKQSIDARNKQEVCFVCSYVVQSDKKLLKNATPYLPPQDVLTSNIPPATGSCIVVGAGPSGLFLALYLAKSGVKVTVVERGSDIATRNQHVRTFFEGGALDENSNVQFGLGGAGTFSDGKLTTGISSPLVHTVFQQFVRSGAPRQILTSAMPHVGTDNLQKVVENMRREIENYGGQFLFDTTVTDLIIENGSIKGVIIQQNAKHAGQKISADRVALCLGNSARETFRMLHKQGIQMQHKPFAVGLRVEHPRTFINTAQYGEIFATHKDLGSATYKLTHTVNGRACYSFCMCPGGVVVPATSQNGAVVCNGMSNFARNAENSNSALVVSVNASDLQRYGFTDEIFCGIDFQEQLERLAYNLGGNNFTAPCQNVTDFLTNATSTHFDTPPSYCRGVKFANLCNLFPADITETLQHSIRYFDTKIKGFAQCGVLTGVETRTSCPVKILRDKVTLESNIGNLYPVGEGAGHAGGIVSSAVDGLKVAQAIVRTLT